MRLDPERRAWPFVLRPEHQQVADELLEKLDMAGLVRLAKDLPYDKHAATAVMQSTIDIVAAALFHRWLDGRTTGCWPPPRPQLVAVYCAAAADHAASKVLEQVLKLTRQQADLLGGLKRLLATAEEAGLVLTFAAMKGRRPGGGDGPV